MNRVLLTGRITRDPEVRYTSNGTPAVSFSLAVDRQMRDANGNRQADFINCVAWRNQADFIARYIKKGYMLAIEGRIQTRNYQGQDGQTRYVTEVLVDSVENLQPRETTAQMQQPQPQYQQNYQGYSGPMYGSQPANGTEAPDSFNADVADDDLPF